MRRLLVTLVVCCALSPALAQVGTDDQNTHPYASYETLTPDAAPVPAYTTRAIMEICTASGSVTMQLESGQQLVIPVSVGMQTFPLAVTAIKSAGTTAACTHYSLH